MNNTQKYYWLNPPRQWSGDESALLVITDDKTDFWAKTWYGFERFSGHFFGCDVTGHFTFQVKIQADFEALYDQAGIMLFADNEHWLKAGIEMNDGCASIGSVLTIGHSDWATGIFPADSKTFWMRLTKKGESLRLQYSTDGKTWPLLRLAHFPECPRYAVGVMCCSPQRQGLQVKFEEMRLTHALDKDLHDLS